MIAILLIKIIVGLLALYFGAGFIVNSSSRVARRMGLSELWIGLTIVAFGTSLPELVVAITSNLGVAQDLAMSNIAGANVNNITLILGIAAFISPLMISEKSTRREISFLILAGALFFVLALIGSEISRLDGIILFTMFIIFTFTCCVVDFFKEPPCCRVIHNDSNEVDGEKKKSMAFDIFLMIIGIVALTFGGQITVKNAVLLATIMNISQTVIGATIVSLGTTLPELFTSVVAASHGKLDISIGNIIGSCIFNMLAVVGIASMIKPIPVSTDILTLHFPFMLLTSMIVIPMISPDFYIDKKESLVLILVYIFYIFSNIMTNI